MFEFYQHGLDDLQRRIHRITEGIENLDPLLAALGTELAELWRKYILEGPSPRWEAGPSLRAAAQAGTTLYDKGIMFRSITGVQSGPDEVTIGSALTVGDWNLLAIHEFGATPRAHDPAGYLRFRLPWANVWARKKEVRIPARPTAPINWERETLLSEADELVRRKVGDYLVNLDDARK